MLDCSMRVQRRRRGEKGDDETEGQSPTKRSLPAQKVQTVIWQHRENQDLKGTDDPCTEIALLGILISLLLAECIRP